MLGKLQKKREEFMKKNKDELRNEYHRSDFGPMTRGKYAKQIQSASNVVVLDPRVAKFFPNGESVNKALFSLIDLLKLATKTKRAVAR